MKGIQTKAEQDNIGESLKSYEIKETKAKQENISKIYIYNICGISFMSKEGLYVSNIQNHFTICIIQFIHVFF